MLIIMLLEKNCVLHLAADELVQTKVQEIDLLIELSFVCIPVDVVVAIIVAIVGAVGKQEEIKV